MFKTKAGQRVLYSNANKKATTQTIKKIAVIGGGWSGLYALKILREDGHQAVLFEASDSIGGIWKYQENQPGGVWQSTYTNSSKTYLHASDYPLPEALPLFPHHSDILKYLHNYATHFHLWNHIYCQHNIINLKKSGKIWFVSIEQNSVVTNYEFDAVVICTGQSRVPVVPSDHMFTHFCGITMHSHEYKYPTEQMKGKSILIIGGGESACEIANEVSSTAECVYLSMRKGRWFQPKHNGPHLALDTRNPRKARMIMKNKFLHSYAVKVYEMLSIASFGVGGHGIDKWAPKVPMLSGIVNKSREVVDKITIGKVIPQQGVIDIKGHSIWFENEAQPTHIDMIIYATGYRPEFSFLDNYNSTQLYKLVFDIEDSTLCFIGMVRPLFGSIPALAELQARWVSAVFKGTVKLPSREKMQKCIQQDAIYQQQKFPVDYKRVPYLVDHFEYADYITRQLNAQPNFWWLFFVNNKKWRILMNAPWTPFEVLLNDPEKQGQAYKNIVKEYRLKKETNHFSLSKALFASGVGIAMAMTLLFQLSIKTISWLLKE
ncbi:MAG: NAD(P)-binding domain-containing protein [Ardenticatenaceae bacterium]|nr:NAD(P)-binding domain-containing protein [Ardenticatenaceae bacterium]